MVFETLDDERQLRSLRPGPSASNNQNLPSSRPPCKKIWVLNRDLDRRWFQDALEIRRGDGDEEAAGAAVDVDER
jgi:hypothetical protein